MMAPMPVVVPLVVLLVVPQAQAAQTAKAACARAAAPAAKWRPDARLTHVSTLRGQGDGRAANWLCSYYSAQAKKSAIVTVRDGGKVEVDADVRNTSVDAIGSDFVDSDQAVAAAAKAGLKFDKGTKELGLGLVVGGQAAGGAQLYWSVTVSHDKGFSGVTLRGKDAAYVKRDDVKF
jgi:hypothetical protein